MKKIWFYALLLIIFASCTPNGSGLTATPIITEVNEVEPCAFVWATKPLEIATNEIQDALEVAGVKDVEVAAAAFGENCINSDGSNRGFGTMSVDIYLTFTVPAGTEADWQFLGDRFELAYSVLSGFESENLPKPIQAISIQVKSEAGIKNYNTDLLTVQRILDEGLHGAALVEALFGD